MVKIFRYLKWIWPFFLCFLISKADGQRGKYYDGPYISEKEGQYELMWIQKGKVKREKIALDSVYTFFKPNLPQIDLQKLEFKTEEAFHFDNVEKFVSISDIHGQYDVFIKLLQAHHVIDTSFNWIYGEGHLVVLGDVFDRGDKVTETLWFLFNLEKQAERNGGKVHLTLGNHEVMVMHGDIGYIHPKYRYTSGASRTEYPDLFSNETILGKWLRSKPVSISINDFVFVHGGFSKQVLEKEASLKRINSIWKQDILPDEKIEYDTTDLTSLLYFENGPLWYRGYANPSGFDVDQANYILNRLKKDHIVVGHTSMPNVMSLYDNRIVLVDSSIKFGKTGELFIYENDNLYRGQENGDRLILSSDKSGDDNKSVFDFMYEDSDSTIGISIISDIKKLKKEKLNKEYQETEVLLYDDIEEIYSFEGRVKVRGNMRKKLCDNPPLKVDFSKKELRLNGFSNRDKLKLVLQCGHMESQAHSLKKEHLVYELYQIIDTLGLRSKLVKVDLNDIDGGSTVLEGFILEDEENLANRLGGQIVEKGIVTKQALHRESFLKMAFFQFMICNTDWSIRGRHNIETILMDGEKRLRGIAYDFDYSGIVGQKYAVPSELFPIADVKQRYFRVNDLTEEEFIYIKDFYNDKKETLYSKVENADYLPQKEKKKFKKVVEDFYDIINSRRKSKKLWAKN